MRLFPWLLAAAPLLPGLAAAQSVGDAAAKQAENAFGVTVEGESIGLYSVENAREASPLEAGNVRVEGLYAALRNVGRLSDRSHVALGPSALATYHPAPSGVVEYDLRNAPGNFVSLSAGVAHPEAASLAIDAGWRASDKWSLVASGEYAGGFADHPQGDYRYGDLALAIDYTAARGALTGFYSYSRESGYLAERVFFSAAAVPPPRINPRLRLSQPYTGYAGDSQLGGLLGHWQLADSWRLRAGLFEQRFEDGDFFEELFLLGEGDDADRGLRRLNYFAPSDGRTRSGEARLEKDLQWREWSVQVFGGMRFRDSDTTNGGIGEAMLDDAAQPVWVNGFVPRPEFILGAGNREAVEQQLYGVGAHLLWRNRVAVNIGAQRSHYRHAIFAVESLPVASDDERWLSNLLLRWRLSAQFSLYAGYSRGLEQFGPPPTYAANANSALAAATSTQVDGGVEWRPSAQLGFILGVFKIERPFPGIDADNRYAITGEYANAGIEFSSVWRPTAAVNLVLGAVFQDPEVTTGELTHQAPAAPTRRVQLSFDSRVPAADNLFLNVEARYARGIATGNGRGAEISPSEVVDLALRYEMSVAEKPAQIKVSIGNVTDAFVWATDGNGGFWPEEGRTFKLSAAVDF